MVGIDVNQAGVESDRALVQPNQDANIKRSHFRDRNRDRFAAAVIESGTGSAQKPLQIIPARHSLFDLEPPRVPVLLHLNESDEEIQDAVAQLLDVCMLVGRTLVPVNRDALMDDVA